MPREHINLTYHAALGYLQNSDIILFRGKGIISKAIHVFSNGEYSHVGIVSYSSLVELVEIREFQGGRIVDLEREVGKYSGKMDVYRCVDKAWKWTYNRDTNRIQQLPIELDRRGIVTCMRKLAGSDYNYTSIFNIAKRNTPIIRWFYSSPSLTGKPVENSMSHICSSAVAACFNKFKFNLVPNKHDALVTPTDISHSSYLNYLFTLC